MANPIYQTITATGASTPIVVDWLQVPFSLSYAVELASGATVSTQIQYTLDDVNDSTWTPVWFNLGSAVTANTAGEIGVGNNSGPGPVRALRVNTTAITGSIRFCILQGINSRAG